MDIERLKELREEVFEDYKAYMVKNLKDEDGKVYPSTVPLDECSPIGKDLLELIDEAIARQSVKSEEVAEAIEDLQSAVRNCAWHNSHYYDGPMKEKALRTAIAALRQYQTPKLCRLCNDEIDHEDIDLCSACINTLEVCQKPTDDIQDFGLHSSSINLNIVIDKQEDAERLVDAIEQAETDAAVHNTMQTFESFLSSRHDADWVGDTVSNQYLCDSVQAALRQIKPDLYPKAGLDPDADDWGNGYSRGYADGLQARKPAVNVPSVWTDEMNPPTETVTTVAGDDNLTIAFTDGKIKAGDEHD